jgi:hypothetical protein
MRLHVPIPVLMRFLLFLLLLIATAAQANTYDLTWRLKFEAGQKTAQGTVTLGAGSELVRDIDFKITPAYSEITADGKIERTGERLKWTPPPAGGSLHYRVKIDERRKNGKFRSYFPGDWAIFRGDRVFPSARVRARGNARSLAKLIVEVPVGWHCDTPYVIADDGSYPLDDPKRRFDRPVGWMLVGAIGMRREVIADVEVALAGPKDQGMRRMDSLAFLNFALPKMREALHELPPKILIVSAPDPMWRGGLSAPRSLYLHLDRPMISENGTSTLLHELTHVITRIRGEEPKDDWIAEGIAEFYAVELLYRAGGMTKARHTRTLNWMRDWSRHVTKLRKKRSSGQITARAALLMHSVDLEIRKATDGARDIDDVTRILMRDPKVSTAEFIAAAESVAGARLKTLHVKLLR